MKLAILNDYQDVALRMADWSAVRARLSVDVFTAPLGDLDAAAAALAGYDIVVAMRERQPFPKALLERLPKLKLLVTPGIVNFAIDVAAAEACGVTVCGTTNGPGLRTTAELAWGLAIDLLRHITAEDRALRAGRWQTTVGTLLHGKTLGLIGLGNIGGMVAGYGRAFGMEVLAWSANLAPAAAEAAGAAYRPLDRLLQESDVVSVHVILSDRTRGLLGERELALMKPTAVLVNTSRGPVVQEAALVRALEAGRLAGAALDVFDAEPLASDHPLRRLPNVVLTPHIGYVTEEVYRLWFDAIQENIMAYLAGTPIRVLTNDLRSPYKPGTERP